MNINAYLAKLESLIQDCIVVASYSLKIDRKSEELAFISGKLDFRDGSVLDFKEFMEERATGLVKLKYGYNYRSGGEVLFRYDNAPDPRAKQLATFPHHKHLVDGTIVESREMQLHEVLIEIEKMMVEGQS